MRRQSQRYATDPEGVARTVDLLASAGRALSSIVAEVPETHVAHDVVPTPWERKGSVMRGVMERAKDFQRRKFAAGFVGIHWPTEWGGQGGNQDPTNRYLGGAGNAYHAPGSSQTTLQPAALATSGGSQAHNNAQPYLTISFCIALQGIFPSQN